MAKFLEWSNDACADLNTSFRNHGYLLKVLPAMKYFSFRTRSFFAERIRQTRNAKSEVAQLSAVRERLEAQIQGLNDDHNSLVESSRNGRCWKKVRNQIIELESQIAQLKDELRDVSQQWSVATKWLENLTGDDDRQKMGHRWTLTRIRA